MADTNINQNINYAKVGLNTDGIIDQVQKGYVTDALNALISNFDGHSISYQNEEGSIFCLTCPTGYKVIGVKYIPQLSEVLYMLVNPATGFSMIGYVLNNNCEFNILLDDRIPGSDLLGFNINSPILKIEVKTTNCSTQFYWADNITRRYVDLNNLPWKDTIIGGIITPLVGQIDSNKIKVQPNFSVMEITPTEVVIGGNLIEGVYQFAACYSDVSSNRLTAFYAKTNPVSIFNNGIISPNFNDVTNKAISLSIDKLDTTGLYSYFMIAAIKTINGVTTVDFVGNFSIQSETFTFTYTGDESSGNNSKLSFGDIIEQFPYYDNATSLCQVDNRLIWAGMTKEDPLNYIDIWRQVLVGWETWQVPETALEDYSNGIDSAILQGYMRDEVYALEGCFILANGMQTPRCPIPGRMATAFDLTPISTSNADVQGYVDSTCTPPPSVVPRWQVYNTGSITGTSPSFNPGFNCPQPFQHGLMGYHESTRKYPNNPTVWGSLAGQPIRHHRFPDSTITHIHDQNPFPIGSPQYLSYVHNIYPIGISVDINTLKNAIQNSTMLTQAQKDQIVGFKIMRSDRGAEKSIVAKGYLYNCGHYNKYGEDFFYPNYPFNDVHPDPFISSTPVGNKSGANTGTLLNDFQPSRFTFHSPDTSFYQPNGVEGSYLKLETVETGTCKAHFVPVQENAREKIRTKYELEIAFITAILASIGVEFDYSSTTTVGTVNTTATTTNVRPTFQMQNFFPTYNTTLELLDKLSPWINYAWQYNGIGYYGNFTPVPDTGNKIRNIEFGGYITSGVNNTFGDVFPINNTSRESSVYLSVGGKLPFAGPDNSRQTAGGAGVCNSSQAFYTDIASYYASIKRYLPEQYGEIFSYVPVDTGFYSTFVDDNGNQINSLPTIFGGDVFINRFGLKRKQAFYNISSVNKPDGTDVDYNQDPDPTNPSQDYTTTGNIGYPIWYYSTDNATRSIANVFGPGLTNLTNLFNTTGGLLVLLFTGGIALFAVVFQLMSELLSGVLFNNLGLKVTNLECNNYSSLELWETGVAYLYAYGIPYFFCESQVNVDMRLATNQKEGNFFPLVGTDIPDSWLQETNVPIAFDNIYTYNKTYSKENKETYFSLLRPDWEPNQACYINYNNRAIWSDASDLEETKNNWLVYRPANLKDFPKNFGDLEAIDYLENRAVLVRYTNHSQIYNALATVSTSQLTASLGTGDLFSTTPIDLKTTDNGYAGTQNKFILNTEEGHVYIDAKRGQVVLLRGNNIEDLSDPKYLNSKWFTDNLPFQILKYFPNYDIDNNFNGIGLHGTYDSFYKRLIITKLDYVPLVEGIMFDGTNFYITTNVTTPFISTETEDFSCCPDGYSLGTDSITHKLICNNGVIKIPPIKCPENSGIPNTFTCCPSNYIFVPASDASDATCINPDTFDNVSPSLCPGLGTCCPEGFKYSIEQGWCCPINRDCEKCPCEYNKSVATIPCTKEEKMIIDLNDPLYFCNKSWTMSFSFLTNTWTSFHSYIPNFYIEYEDYFQAGLNTDSTHNNDCSVWDHNSTFSLFNNFFGTPYPYIIEYPYAYKLQNEIIQSIKEYCTVLKYTSYNQFVEADFPIYFDNVIVYNNNQNSGVRDFVVKSLNNLQQYRQYPSYTTNAINILVTKNENFYQYNMIWDIVKDFKVQNWLDTCTPELGNKIINQSNMNYTNQSYKKFLLRAKDSKIRSTLLKNDYKIISRFILQQTANSY